MRPDLSRPHYSATAGGTGSGRVIEHVSAEGPFGGTVAERGTGIAPSSQARQYGQHLECIAPFQLRTCDICPTCGKSISQTTPSDSNRRWARPPCDTSTLFNRRVPNPSVRGSSADGPPRSRQTRRTVPGSAFQPTPTWPVGDESAPYLTALVANSWVSKASAAAVSGAISSPGDGSKMNRSRSKGESVRSSNLLSGAEFPPPRTTSSLCFGHSAQATVNDLSQFASRFGLSGALVDDGYDHRQPIAASMREFADKRA